MSKAILKLKDKNIDLTTAFPLTLRDWKNLEGLGVMDKTGAMQNLGADGMAKLLHYLVSKVDTEVKVDAIYDVPLPDITRLGDEVQRLMSSEDRPDPTS